MNKKILEQIEMCQQSIDWWQEQSRLLIKEVRQLETDHAFGAVTDDQMFERGQEIDQKLNYLEKKGFREHEYMVAIISGAQDEQ